MQPWDKRRDETKTSIQRMGKWDYVLQLPIAGVRTQMWIDVQSAVNL